MNSKSLEENFRDYLVKLSLTDLRMIGRQQGVHAATQLGKDVLITSITDILTGKAKPAPHSGRGAPPKQNFIDPSITLELADIRRRSELQAAEQPANVLRVSSGEEDDSVPFDEPVRTGILEIMQSGYGFLRANNCQPSGGADVFIPAQTIHSLRLREGDFVACTARPSQKNDSAAICRLLSVNGLPIGKYEQRPYFDSLTAQYPTEKIELSEKRDVLALRALDLFIPIGKGQRALIIAPPKAGKTTLLKEIARSISEDRNDIFLIVLLIDERPEEVTDFQRSVDNAQIVYSTFDEGADHHIRAAELTLEHAKRLAESGKDVVILLDSLTKLTRAYNYVTESSGKTLTGGLEASAFYEPKRFFGAARNLVEAGSLTILATALVETGSRMDDVIYEEFKGTGNADIFLSRDLAERRVFPAIDVRKSGTRKEELLLSKEELAAVYQVRERGLTENVAGLWDMLRRTGKNEEFVARIPEWIKVYKNQ